VSTTAGVSRRKSKATDLGPGTSGRGERARASLELLYNISRELAAQLELRPLLQHILQLTLETVGAMSGSILVLDERGEVFEGALAFAGKVHDHTAEQLSDTFERGLAGWVVDHRQAALVTNTGDDPRWLRRPERDGEGESRSAICVPLLARDHVVGVLTVVHPRAGEFVEADLALLQAIGDQAGIAVQNARLFRAEQNRRHFAATLQEIARAISSTLDPAQVFPAVLEQLERVVAFDSASILLAEDDHLRLVAARGFADNRAVLGVRIPWDPDLLTGRVLTTRQAIVVPDVQQAEGWLLADSLPEAGAIRGWIGAPLIVRDRAVGILNVDSRTPGAYGETQLSDVVAFADQTAAAVANAQLFAETQEARQQYASLFEDSVDPVLITTPAGVVTDANVAAQEYLGYPIEALRGLDIRELHQPKGPPPRLEEMHAGDTLSYEATATHRDGHNLPVEVHAKLLEAAPQPTGQWILRDMSERVALDELRRDLTSMIFHDLRSPLGNVISSLELLQVSMAASDETTQSVLSIALRSSRRLSRLVESLLDLAQLETGQAVLHTTQGSMGALIAEAAEEVHPLAEARGHMIQFSLPRSEPLILEMDVDMIRRVLINLLENAIKYTRTPGRVLVSGKREGDRVVVSVRDSGPGIAFEDQRVIFDKFARLRQESQPKGLGLGLAFCRMAVEAHGGRIWVESEPGEGSLFSFELPVQDRT
jgi:NtrC-family two-component system sensor histidine kinase KinB